jgi:stalled ribosome alternative rescue factor ArfA
MEELLMLSPEGLRHKGKGSYQSQIASHLFENILDRQT